MRIQYWAECSFESEIEAISKEVFQLARHFTDSWVYGISPHYVVRWSLSGRYFGCHPRFDPLLRLAIPLGEWLGDLNHVYGGLCPWTFYKTLKRRPIILTVADQKGEPNLEFFDRCRRVIVQTEGLRTRLLDLGIAKDKVEVLYPGLDLGRFRPSQERRGKRATPKVLFASAPRTIEEMEGRGVQLLLDTAKSAPDVLVTLLYRQWRSGYTSLLPTQQSIAQQSLWNVTLVNHTVRDMTSVYGDHDFVVVPYTRSDGGKECPNSLIEGLACGLPALISARCPFSAFVEAHRCGVVFEPTPAGLSAAVEAGLRHYDELSSNAVNTASRFFSEVNLLTRMETIYHEAVGPRA